MENTSVPIESKENINKTIQQEGEKEEDKEKSNPESKIENKIDEYNPEEGELKENYSIDELSYSKFGKSSDEEDNGDSMSKKKNQTIYELTQLILEDNEEEFKKMIEKNKSLLKKKTFEQFSLIQYAAFNRALNCFKYLLSLKVNTNEDIEGFYLIHLSLMKAIKDRSNNNWVQVFNYIYVNLPEQKKYKDRLGRIYLHLIFEYNLSEALTSNISIEIDDLFIEDNLGQYAINYLYMYDSFECFWNLLNASDFFIKIYEGIRIKFHDNKISYLCGEEKFLENLFIYKNIRSLNALKQTGILNQSLLIQDLTEIHKKYMELFQEQKNNDININNGNANKQMTPSEEILCYIQYLCNNHYLNINYLKTAIVYNKDCINHIKLPEDPIKHYKKKSNIIENSDRLSCLIDEENGIINFLSNQIIYGLEGNQKRFLIWQSKRKSCLNDILKCHDIKYIKALKYKSDNIINSKLKKGEKKTINKLPKFWENINLELIEQNYFLYSDNNSTDNTENNGAEKEMILKEEKDNLYLYQKLDIDTFINQFSYENIYNTTGCVFEAIDLVMSPNAVNAFALIRPPGHHAGYYGPVENSFETSNGFCLVNNVAIGAAYTKYKYSQIIKKIAIVDIDVHHGNGTEEIIEMLNFKNFSRPFNYEKICGVKIEDKHSINWYDFDDAKNVLFISTHIYDKDKPDKFYPYSGGEENNTPKESDIYPGGIYNIPFEYKKNYPYDYRNVLRKKIIPRLYKFKPDIIFISAGFDGHKLEGINEQKMLLQENDYGYIAEQIQYVANKFCDGRLIAVLEGGYNTNTGIISPFAQSVLSFIRHLNIAINSIQLTDINITSHKRDNLYEEEMELYKSNMKEEEEEESKPRRSERLRHIKEIEKKEKKEEKEKDIQMEPINGGEVNEIKENKNEDIKLNEIKEEKENNEIKKEKEKNKENEVKEEKEIVQPKEEKGANMDEIKEKREEQKDIPVEEINIKDNKEEKEKKIEENNQNEKNKEEIEVIKIEEDKDKENKEEERDKNLEKINNKNDDKDLKENKQKEEIKNEEKKEKNDEKETKNEQKKEDNKDNLKEENNKI